MSDEIEGIKLITHNSRGVNEPEDSSYPWRMEANFRPPELMKVAFIGLYGATEKIVVQGKTREALEEFIALNNFTTHPRLISLTLTGPGDEVINLHERVRASG